MNGPGKPYVREALASEYKEISEFKSRAFSKDPIFNWLASRSVLIPEQSPKQRTKSLNELRDFFHSLLVAVHHAGGRVTVVAIPDNAGDPRSETLAAAALWMPPHRAASGLILKFHRSIFAWGFTFLWRVSVSFQPTIDAAVKNALKEKGFGTEYYRLENTSTHPDHQGKGYCRMLMEEAIPTFTKPVTLEATTPKSRDVYVRLGFEIVKVPVLGRGQVDSQGLGKRSVSMDSVPGFPVWVMVKGVHS